MVAGFKHVPFARSFADNMGIHELIVEVRRAWHPVTIVHHDKFEITPHASNCWEFAAERISTS